MLSWTVFVILDRLRQSLRQMQSVLMTQATLNQFQDLATSGNSSDQKEFSHLNAEERECYENVCRSNRRLEQEHLPIEV